MFDISFGEFAFILVAGSWLIGRRDLPRVSKVAGKGLGRAIGYIMRIRHTVEELSETTPEMNSMRQDMQKGYDEFNRVSMEVRNVGRIGGLASAGMYGGVGGMAKSALAGAAMSGGGEQGGMVVTQSTPGSASTHGALPTASAAMQQYEPVEFGPEVPNAGDMLQRVAEERQRRLFEHKKQQEQEEEKSKEGGGRGGGASFHTTHTERMGGGVDLLVGTIEDKTVLDNYLQFLGHSSPGGVTSVPASNNSTVTTERRKEGDISTTRKDR